VLTTFDKPGALGDKARAWELGRVLMIWLDVGNQPVLTTRGALGFMGDPSEAVDLSAWIDSTFQTVESVIPGCVPATTQWRQYPGWAKLVQRAVRQANDGLFDSAAVTVSQATRIYAKHPYTAFVMGQIAESRHEHKSAIGAYENAIELSKADSAYAGVRRTAEVAIGSVALAAARETTNPDEKASYLAAATDAYTLMAREPGGAHASIEGLAAVTDETRAGRPYSVVMADSGATYADVLAAGVAAGAARASADAIRLLRRAVAMNSYQRDALSDLALMLASADSAAAARPFVDRLVHVDPSNPDNYTLAQQIYGSLRTAALATARRDGDRAAALTRPADAAASRAERDSAAAWTDSANAYDQVSRALLATKDAIVVGVVFHQWTPSDGRVLLGGTLTNVAAAARTVTMHVEFLDKWGSTVSTSEVTVTVDPAHPKEFTVIGTGAGITAFKYTPLA